MSAQPTAFRPLARMGWGGRAASHWRGLTQSDDRNVSGRTVINRGQIGTVVYRSPGGYANFTISGVTRDKNGTALGTCAVELYITGRDVSIAETVSDASGNFVFNMPGTGPFYLVAYRAGSPDVAGTTVNTIIPVAV
jgi:hypothetical protein